MKKNRGKLKKKSIIWENRKKFEKIKIRIK